MKSERITPDEYRKRLKDGVSESFPGGEVPERVQVVLGKKLEEIKPFGPEVEMLVSRLSRDLTAIVSSVDSIFSKERYADELRNAVAKHFDGKIPLLVQAALVTRVHEILERPVALGGISPHELKSDVAFCLKAQDKDASLQHSPGSQTMQSVSPMLLGLVVDQNRRFQGKRRGKGQPGSY